MFEMIADNRFDENINTRADELDAGISRLSNIEIQSTKRGEYQFGDECTQVRYTYLAKSTDTWQNIHKAINSVKPVYVKRMRTLTA